MSKNSKANNKVVTLAFREKNLIEVNVTKDELREVVKKYLKDEKFRKMVNEYV